MQVTGGIFRNRRIHIKNQKGVRPTSSKVREAIFSMLGQDLTGRSFLDSFGGSGIMGVEALSRGASPVRITERTGRTVRQIRQACQDLSNELQIMQCDAGVGLLENWDIVFLDPPYRMSVIPFVRQALLTTNHTIVVETSSDQPLDLSLLRTEMALRSWSVDRPKVYGSSLITILQRAVSVEDAATDLL